jgi:hypothetical protein
MRDDRLKDFRNFMYLCHKYIGLPEPTPFQYRLCGAIGGEEDRILLKAFRGGSKSHTAALWALWVLYWNEEEKILVISATADKASQFVKFCKDTIIRCPFLSHMQSEPGQRDLSYSFDVAGCKPSQTPSLEAKGLTSQITGSRATKIIADDIEISTNSRSPEARDKIFSLSSEFESIILPGGKIIWLGTPHSSSSVYNTLPEKGYKVFTFPIYVDGKIAEPDRFKQEDIEKRRRSIGESVFRLQFMLDTALVDIDKYPLHLSDLIVSKEFGGDQCREKYKPGTERVRCDIKEAKGKDWPVWSVSDGYKVPYTNKIMAIDPAGSGQDEFAWCILGTRNGYIFNIANGAWPRMTNTTPGDIAALAEKHKVNRIILEVNFGDVLLENILQPHVRCPIETVRNTTQKELRIISALEPVLNSHKLVVNEDFLNDKDLMSQFCNITKDRGSLRHDDRLDALALGVRHLVDYMRINLKDAMDREHIERIEHEIYGDLGVDGRQSWI